MKKVLIAQELHTMLQPHNSFLNRSGMHVFTATTNDDLFNIHRSERTDLIITQLDLPGTSTEQVAARIREDKVLGLTPVLMVCSNTRNAVEQCARCGANAVILRPVNPLVLLAKAQQLLAIAWRETYRALVNVAVEGQAGNSTFFCRSVDISVSGMLIETEKMLNQGNTISCSFYLPESLRIQASAEVVRSVNTRDPQHHQYGVKFLQMNSEHRRALEMFIHTRSVPPPPAA